MTANTNSNTDMGRPKSVYLELPPRMTARRLKRGTVRYYYTGGGKRIPLGSDLNAARIEWARMENRGSGTGLTGYAAVARRWEREALGKGTARETQRAYGIALKFLLLAFQNHTLEEIKPVNIREYLDARPAKIAANREIAVLSIIFNWARERGIVDCPNPCLGVKRNEENHRSRYVTDAEYLEVWNRAGPVLQDAMDLAYLTGQRPSDVLKMVRQDIRDGCLWVRQNKTGARVGIKIEGEFALVLERILARPRAVASMYLIAGRRGEQLNDGQLRRLFDAANPDRTWQFRDIRAKAASDAKDLKHAQRLLGHTTETTTAGIYRRVVGDKVSPLK